MIKAVIYLRLGHQASEPLKTQSSFRPLIPKSPRRASGTLASSLNAMSLINLSMWAINRFLSAPIELTPDLSQIVSIPSSVACSFAIRCGNAVRRLKPSELTTAAGGSTNVMRLPALLSDMAKKCVRPSAGARINTSRGFFKARPVLMDVKYTYP